MIKLLVIISSVRRIIYKFTQEGQEREDFIYERKK